MQTRIKLTGPASDSPSAATVDATPTWGAIMPALVAALQNGTGAGQRMARVELARLAAEVDALNARQRAERDAMPPAAELARLIREADAESLGRVIADAVLHATPLAAAIRENLAKPDNARARAAAVRELADMENRAALCPACRQTETESGVPVPRACPGCAAATAETVAELESNLAARGEAIRAALAALRAPHYGDSDTARDHATDAAEILAAAIT